MNTRPDAVTTRGGAVRRAAGVTGHVLREKLTRFRARDASDVPASSRSLTTQWLTNVLCADTDGAEVLGFEIRNPSKGTSTRWAMHIEYNAVGLDAGLPVEVFAKTTTALSQRLILGLADVIGGEPGFYRDIRPKVDLRTPHGYHAALDPRSWRSIVLIEDIARTRSATFSTPTTSVTAENMREMLGDMAALHARFWDDPALLAHPAWLKTPQTHLDNISRFIGMRKRCSVGFERGSSMVAAGLEGRYDELWTALGRSLVLASQGPLTFLHGDAHVGNTFADEAGRMGLTDWQVNVRGLWAYDFAYLMTTAPTVENRRVWERELLTFYLAQLAERGIEVPPFDDAWLAYRQQAFYPCFAWLLTIGRSAIQPKMQTEETSLELIRRTTSAIVDLDALAAVGMGSGRAGVSASSATPRAGAAS